jgi:hypothetical protein
MSSIGASMAVPYDIMLVMFRNTTPNNTIHTFFIEKRVISKIISKIVKEFLSLLGIKLWWYDFSYQEISII